MDEKSVLKRKEELDKTAVVIRQQLEQLRNDLNATVGASQDCEYWLKEFKKKRPVEVCECEEVKE